MGDEILHYLRNPTDGTDHAGRELPVTDTLADFPAYHLLHTLPLSGGIAGSWASHVVHGRLVGGYGHTYDRGALGHLARGTDEVSDRMPNLREMIIADQMADAALTTGDTVLHGHATEVVRAEAAYYPRRQPLTPDVTVVGAARTLHSLV